MTETTPLDTPRLLTPRLILDAPREGDLDALVRWESDAEILHLNSDAAPSAGTELRDDLALWIRMRTADMIRFVIRLRNDDSPIGFSQIACVDHVNRRCKLSITLGEKGHWGKGLGREALRAMLDVCFGALDLNRVGAEILAFNQRSIGLFESAGFRREGVLRESVRRGEQWVDEYAYGLLRREWVSAATETGNS